MSQTAAMVALSLLPETNAEGTVLCLAFTNTLDWHASPQPVESLHTYADLLVWAQQQGVLTAAEQAALLRQAAAQPAAAAVVLRQALDLREAIYRIFVALTKATAPAAADLATLNAELAAALPHLYLQPHATGYGWAWAALSDPLAALLRPLALSAAALLTSPWVTRVKQCEDERGCGFLFIDTSKNRSRRWCSMESCGNRAKVQRHRQQAKNVSHENRKA